MQMEAFVSNVPNPRYVRALELIAKEKDWDTALYLCNYDIDTVGEWLVEVEEETLQPDSRPGKLYLRLPKCVYDVEECVGLFADLDGPNPKEEVSEEQYKALGVQVLEWYSKVWNSAELVQGYEEELEERKAVYQNTITHIKNRIELGFAWQFR